LFDIGRHFVKRIVAMAGDGWHDFGGPTSPISRGKGPQSGRDGGRTRPGAGAARPSFSNQNALLHKNVY
jgi:hypothetical protein